VKETHIKSKKQAKKDSEYIWTCDYCGKEFETKKESDKHELRCPRNPSSNEITIKFRKPNSSQLTIFFLILTVGYIFVFGLVDSYAKSNSLPRRNFLNPFTWLSDNNSDVSPTPTLQPSPTQTPSPNPTTTSKKTTNNQSQPTNTNNSGAVECVGPDEKHFNTTISECEKLNQSWGKPVNYMVNCNQSGKCGGGSRRISKVECDRAVCCQIGENWEFVSSSQECENLQNSRGSYEDNCNKVAFITKYASTPGTYYCCDSAVNKLLNSTENQAKFEYEMKETDCVNPSDNLCKMFSDNFSKYQNQLDSYIKQYCR